MGVYDQGNGRVQFFDQESNYVTSFKIYKIYFDMTANKDGLIFAVPNRTSLQDPLIDVINDKGELLYSFGETLKFKHDWNQLNQANLCTNSDGDLLVAFRYWQIVRKYSPQGKLLAEYNIEHPYMKSLEKENIKKANMSSEKDKKGGYWLLNLAIQAKENGFFCYIKVFL
ncbi:MAG: hypothetical protein DRJ11_10360 [Candidatus Aminicenantes bacterium]|nr:MAG: hypothetical protein DRJ11_10360 [Candidatus Aminicenantes bacterium]